MKVLIDDNLKKANPDLKLGIVFATVEVTGHDDILWQEIDVCIKNISKINLDQVPHLLPIKGVRDTYKMLGKDPVRYRGSSEALLRRIIQDKGLYKVNTVVDINNLVSLETMHPVGVYDLNNIVSPVVFRVGASGESYKGIGKEIINIAELPVFADESGPFGSPTSDSERAMITEKTKNIMMVVIAFCKDSNLEKSLSRVAILLKKYVAARDIETEVI